MKPISQNQGFLTIRFHVKLES